MRGMPDPSIAPEGPECEWKVRLPRADRIARTICAFANGVGGTLWVGVADDGRLVGCDDPDAVRASIERVAAHLDPPQTVQCARRRAEGVTLLEVRVPRAQGPVRVWESGGRGLVYVRDGSSTRAAGAATVRAMERSGDARVRLDETLTKLLRAIAARPSRLSEITKDVKWGQRNARRGLVTLVRAGLVQERADRRFWVTPKGHRKVQ